MKTRELTEQALDAIVAYRLVELSRELLRPGGSAAASCPGAGSEADGGGQEDDVEWSEAEPAEPRTSRTGGWVSARATTPPIGDIVIAAQVDGRYAIAFYAGAMGWKPGMHNVLSSDVIHWMPLPPHPESERSERVRDRGLSESENE